MAAMGAHLTCDTYQASFAAKNEATFFRMALKRRQHTTQTDTTVALASHVLRTQTNSHHGRRSRLESPFLGDELRLEKK